MEISKNHVSRWFTYLLFSKCSVCNFATPHAVAFSRGSRYRPAHTESGWLQNLILRRRRERNRASKHRDTNDWSLSPLTEYAFAGCIQHGRAGETRNFLKLEARSNDDYARNITSYCAFHFAALCWFTMHFIYMHYIVKIQRHFVVKLCSACVDVCDSCGILTITWGYFDAAKQSYQRTEFRYYYELFILSKFRKYQQSKYPQLYRKMRNFYEKYRET